MKLSILPAILALAATTHAGAIESPITLDLTKADTPLSFDAKTGAWTETINEDVYTIDSQTFCFLHNAMSDWDTWWGFTASNSADNSFRTDFITYQYSAMPKGGIVLEADGSVKKDKFGAPVVSAEVPYLVGFANSMFAKHPAEVVMSDGLDHEAVGVYLSLNSYTYYTVAEGDGFARAFTDGDSYTITIHGVDATENERTVDVRLASYDNGDFTATRGWKYVDLTPLGAVNTIWFSTKSTDSGTYGDNTPSYFCLDKLMVKPASDVPAAVGRPTAETTSIAYDRATATVTLNGADFAMIYDASGATVGSRTDASFSIADLPHGIYLIKAGNASRKIVR